MYIKDWFVDKINSEFGGYLDENFVGSPLKETEKAELHLLTIELTNNITRNVQKWIPKSVLISKEQYEEDKKLQAIKDEERHQNYIRKVEEGQARHDKAYNFAKENGLKVRINFRTETILEKIQQAGLQFAC